MIVAAWIIGGIVLAAGLAWLGLRTLGARMGEVRADEVHMVVTRDLWRVRLCRYKPKSGSGEPVFLCHGFISNQFNFTLPQGEALVDYLVERGYDCWTIDLRGNLSSIAPFGRTYGEPTLDDYLLHDIPAALEFIRTATGHSQVHWIGHSMGGMLLYAYNAAFPDGRIASATTLGSPFSFDGIAFHNPGLLLAVRGALGRLAFRGGMRVLLPVFLGLKPKLMLVPINFDNLHPAMDHPDTFYRAVDTPPTEVARGLAVAAQTKTWLVNGGAVNVFDSLHRMKTPLFAIFGAADPLTPMQAIEKFDEKIAAPDQKMLLLSKENGYTADYSHLDLVFGKQCAREVFQPIVDWIKAHPAEQQQPDNAQPQQKTPRAKKPAAKKTADKKPASRKPAAKKRTAGKQKPGTE